MFNKLHVKNNNMATRILFTCCASLIFLNINPKLVLASGSSPVREQPGGHEQVQPVFIPGSEQDIQTPAPEHDGDAHSHSNNSICIEDNGFSYCVGDNVINLNDGSKLATISGVFVSEKVTVKYEGDSKHYEWPVNLLAVTYGCSRKSRNHCVNTKVINDNGKEATISGVFQSGDVALTYDGKFYYQWPVNRLAISQ